MAKSDISMRLLSLVDSKLANHKNFFAELEHTTGVDRESWRHWYLKPEVTDPSTRLLRAAFDRWPEHAFWLATGLTDVAAGHVASDESIDEHLSPNRNKELIKKIRLATKYYFECLKQLREGPTEDADHHIAVLAFSRQHRDAEMSKFLTQDKDGHQKG